jgi:hypothetical protein
MTGPGPVGGLGEEAQALVAAARDWVVRTLPEPHSAECQWCPVCRTVAVLRDPDVADRIAGVVTGAAGALASALDSLTRPPPPAPPPTPPPAVQDIPLDDEP